MKRTIPLPLAKRDFVALLDLGGLILHLSESADPLGYRREELVGTYLDELVHPDDKPFPIDATTLPAGHGAGAAFAFRLRHRDGTWRLFEATAEALPAELGPVRTILTARDVTGGRPDDQRLHLLESVVTYAKDAIVITEAEPTDLPGPRILYANPAFLQMTGYALEEVIGQTPRMLQGPDTERAPRDAIRRALKRWRPIVVELCNYRKDGSMFWVELSIVPVADANGWFTHWVSIQRDVSERKQVEAALQAAKNQAETASKAKGEFLANMSHEIRTPMNGILGMTSLLLESELTDEQRDSLNIVASSADALLTVINDILDFSKIEAGKMELDPAPFGLEDVVGDTLKAFALKARAKGLELVCDISPELPDGLVGDAGRLRQVLTNLVGNAIKFTDRGEVVVYAKRFEVPRGVGIHFAVRDTGIGIPKEKQSRIFEAFTQADGSTTRQFGGTGLGLTISSRLVQMMGGNIRVESEPGRGSEFLFDARFEFASQSVFGSIARPPKNLSGEKVLVVDDNATNRRVLSDTLVLWGAKPKCVESGPAALVELRRAALAREPYPLVLLDVMMPGMDGFTVGEQIVSDPLLRTVVIMLTSADSQGDAARCRAMGLNSYLVKPVKSSELLKVITMVLGDGTPTLRKAAPTPVGGSTGFTPPSRAMEILLAEDNLVNQLVAVRLIEKCGHKVTVANHGGEALIAINHKKFDLVLMDVQMPEMDGFESTRRIRDCEMGSGRRTPIVAMTAHAMAGDRERCLAGGMDDYLTKPMQREELFRVLKWAEAMGPSAPHGESKERDVGKEVPAYFDRAAALERLGGDEELFAEVAGLFRTDVPKLLSEIHAAIASGDAPALRLSAHGLKGAAGYLGGTSVAEAARLLEQFGVKGDFGTAFEAFDVLEREVNRLVANLG